MTEALKIDYFESSLKIHDSMRDTDYPAAGFWVRASALLIDAIIIGLLTAGCNHLFVMFSMDFILPLVPLATTLYYTVVPTVLFGKSLGKKLLSLKVIHNTEDKELGFWQVFGRETIGRLLSSLVFALGYIWVAISKDKKAWHDSMFKTRVVSLK